MMMKSAVVTLVGLALAAEAGSIPSLYRSPVLEQRAKGNNNNGGNNNNNNGGGNNAASPTCLNANAIQSGSDQTGQNAAVPAEGQVNSATDPANFINFCSGQTLTNGLQITTGSCNGVVMGKIPAKTSMVSTVIVSPSNNQDLDPTTTFNVTVNVANMVLGHFTNATSTYYAAPQDLQDGKIIGHTHVTIQNLGDTLSPTTPLDATQFAFFKGINDAGNGQGLVAATVTGGLPAGNYRVCTMSSASNHQPVLMPVAQRGAQDDCKYFTVGAGNGNNGGNNGNNGNNGGNSGNNAGSTNNASTGDNNNSSNSTSTSTASASASSSTSSGKGKGKGGNRGGNKGGNSGNANNAAGSGNVDATSVSSSAAAATQTASSGNKGGSKATGGAIGGIAAPLVQNSGDSSRPFEVNGNTFVNKSAAVQRACAIQNNDCADAVNSGKVTGSSVSDCNTQETQCLSAGSA